MEQSQRGGLFGSHSVNLLKFSEIAQCFSFTCPSYLPPHRDTCDSWWLDLGRYQENKDFVNVTKSYLSLTAYGEEARRGESTCHLEPEGLDVKPSVPSPIKSLLYARHQYQALRKCKILCPRVALNRRRQMIHLQAPPTPPHPTHTVKNAKCSNGKIKQDKRTECQGGQGAMEDGSEEMKFEQRNERRGVSRAQISEERMSQAC